MLGNSTTEISFYRKSSNKGNNLKFTIKGKRKVKNFARYMLNLDIIKVTTGLNGRNEKLPMLVYTEDIEMRFDSIEFQMLKGDYILYS